MPVNANITLNVNATDTKAGDLGSYSGNPAINFTRSLSASDISKCYQLSTTQSTAQTYDVNSGLTDEYGAALVFATVKVVVIRNNNAASVYLTIGGGSNPLFGTDQYTLKAGQVLVITSPVTVDGTHKVLTITPSASCQFDLLILG